jgi:hypothetical protein
MLDAIGAVASGRASFGGGRTLSPPRRVHKIYIARPASVISRAESLKFMWGQLATRRRVSDWEGRRPLPGSLKCRACGAEDGNIRGLVLVALKMNHPRVGTIILEANRMNKVLLIAIQ